MTGRYPELDDLSLLVLVAKAGSIGQAAGELGVSQPSVSRRMTRLERSLRVPLLNRGRRGTSLTPTGRVVVDWASSLLDAADQFARSVRTLRDKNEVSVRVSVSMTIAEHHAPSWLARLERFATGVAVSLTVSNSSEVASRVESGQCDLGFLESPTVRQALRSRRVGWDRLVVAVAPGHDWARTRLVSAEEVARTGLLVREPGSGTRETIERALGQKGLTMTAGLEMASNTALKAAAVAGIGPVVISEVALTNELLSGDLVEVDVRGLDLRRPLSAVWCRDKDLSQGALALLDVAVGR